MKTPPSVRKIRQAFDRQHMADLYRRHPGPFTCGSVCAHDFALEAFCRGVKWLWEQEFPAAVAEARHGPPKPAGENPEEPVHLRPDPTPAPPLPICPRCKEEVAETSLHRRILECESSLDTPAPGAKP